MVLAVGSARRKRGLNFKGCTNSEIDVKGAMRKGGVGLRVV